MSFGGQGLATVSTGWPGQSAVNTPTSSAAGRCALGAAPPWMSSSARCSAAATWIGFGFGLGFGLGLGIGLGLGLGLG